MNHNQKQNTRLSDIQQEKLFDTIFNNTQTGFLIVEEETQIILKTNKYICELLKLSENEIEGRFLIEFMKPSPKYNKLKIKQKKAYTLECNLILNNDEHLDILRYISFTDIDNRAIAIENIIDISARKQNEIEKEKAKKAAESANKSKSEFIANISHEFRTPMNAIIGISWALMNYDSKNLTDEQLEGLDHIHKGGTRLLDLVNDILDLSKIEAGKMNVILKHFELEVLISDIKNLAEDLLRDKNVRFYVKKSSDISDTIISDQKKLFQILQNLISNSIKFTDNGKIQLHIYKLKTHLYFEVSDTGIGIDKKFLAKIFSKFEQIDSSDQKKQKGTGLGLAICKEIVKLLHGEISIESKVNEGTVVKFYIPYQVSEQLKIQSTEKSLVKESEYKHLQRQLNALLIEDNLDLSYLFKKYLSKNNISLKLVDNGLDGYKLIKDINPDLIIIDLKIPKLSGFELMRRLQFNNRYNKLPIIIVSELDDAPNEAIYKYDTFLRKPVNEKQLINTIYKILDYNLNKKFVLTIYSENLNTLKYLKSNLPDNYFYIIPASEKNKFNDCVIGIEADITIIDIDNVSKQIDLSELKLSINKNKKNKLYVFLVNTKSEVDDIKIKDHIIYLLKDSNMIKGLHQIISNRTGILLKPAHMPKILIAEDEEFGIMTFKMALHDKFQLLFSQDGQETIDLFFSENPDMVLMDILMPKVNGYNAFDEIRRRSKNNKIPIIAVTALAMADEKEKIINHGFNDYISKPFNENDLLNLINKHIQNIK